MQEALPCYENTRGAYSAGLGPATWRLQAELLLCQVLLVAIYAAVLQSVD